MGDYGVLGGDGRVVSWEEWMGALLVVGLVCTVGWQDEWVLTDYAA